jgi:hypothetical protein
MSEYITKAYVDNADCVYVFQLEGERVRYATKWRGTDGADLAATDFIGIAVQDIDPVEDGWELGDYESLQEAQADYDQGCMELIASTDLYQGRDADMLVREDAEEWPEYTAHSFVRSFLGE